MKYSYIEFVTHGGPRGLERGCVDIWVCLSLTGNPESEKHREKSCAQLIYVLGKPGFKRPHSSYCISISCLPLGRHGHRETPTGFSAVREAAAARDWRQDARQMHLIRWMRVRGGSGALAPNATHCHDQPRPIRIAPKPPLQHTATIGCGPYESFFVLHKVGLLPGVSPFVGKRTKTAPRSLIRKNCRFDPPRGGAS